jgi:hypothetical protein
VQLRLKLTLEPIAPVHHPTGRSLVSADSAKRSSSSSSSEPAEPKNVEAFDSTRLI